MPLRFKPPGWVKVPFDLKRVGDWISVGRDLAALLFIPFLCLYAAALVWILVEVYSGPEQTETVILVIVNYIGSALIGLLILIGLGVLWLQRRNIPTISVKTPMGTVEIGSGDAAQSVLAGAVIDAITPEGAPSVAAAAAGKEPAPSKQASTAAADAEVAANRPEGEMI